MASISTSGDFAQTNNCGSSVAAGGSCTVAVTFTPTATGTRTFSLTITDNSNAVAGSKQTVSLTGTGTAPLAGVTPTALTFSALAVNSTSSPQAVQLYNSEMATLSVASITISGNFAQTNNCGTTVAGGGSCTIEVTFTPLTGGTLTGTLTITDNSNDVTGSTQTVSLTGTGTGTAPVDGVSPTTLTFAALQVNSTSSPQAVTLANTGNAALAVASINASGDFAQTNSCGSSVIAGGSGTVAVTFTPTATGTRTGTLTITDNSNGVAGSTQTVSLTGTGHNQSRLPAFPSQHSLSRRSK